MKIYPLNSVEKNMLAWDRDGLAFNSHLVADFGHPLDEQLLTAGIIRLFQEIPLLRTVIRNNQRYVQHNVKNSHHFLKVQVITEKVEKEFINRPFNLKIDPPLRILYGRLEKEENTWRLLMSVHHTAFDGIAQTYLFREIMLAYQGLPLSPWVKKIMPFRYRDLFIEKFNFFERIDLYINLIKGLKDTRPKAATLISHPEKQSRTVRHEYFDLGLRGNEIVSVRAKELKLTFYETVFFAVLRALDKEVKDSEGKPFSLAIPMNFRTFMRVDHFFQNVVGMIVVRFTSDEIKKNNLPVLLKERLKTASAPELTLKPAFLAAVTTRLLGINTVRKIMKKNDTDPEAIYSSALISALRFSNSVMVMPEELTPKRLFGHGSLFKSPGLGIIVTGTKDNQVLVVEYIEELFDSATISKFKKTLLNELGLM